MSFDDSESEIVEEKLPKEADVGEILSRLKEPEITIQNVVSSADS